MSMVQDIECACKIQWYMIIMLHLSILSIAIFIFLKARKLKLFRGDLLSNVVKIMLLISDTQFHILVKLCRTTRKIHLFKLQEH